MATTTTTNETGHTHSIENNKKKKQNGEFIRWMNEMNNKGKKNEERNNDVDIIFMAKRKCYDMQWKNAVLEAALFMVCAIQCSLHTLHP